MPKGRTTEAEPRPIRRRPNEVEPFPAEAIEALVALREYRYANRLDLWTGLPLAPHVVEELDRSAEYADRVKQSAARLIREGKRRQRRAKT